MPLLQNPKPAGHTANQWAISCADLSGYTGHPGLSRNGGVVMEHARPKLRARQRAAAPRALVIDSNAGYRSVISHVVEIAGGQCESVAGLDHGRRQIGGRKRFDI